jgi:hypothetical protein
MRLGLADMPRDTQGCISELRNKLVESTNYCRFYPKKLEILKANLKFAYQYILTFEKDLKAKEATEKVLKEAEALVLKEKEESASAELALLALKAKQDKTTTEDKE